MRSFNATNYVRDSISQDPAAKNALTRLVASGVPRDELLRSLYIIWAARGLRPLLDEKRRRWLRDQVSEIRSIRQLSQHLTKAADQIESWNRRFPPRPGEHRSVRLVDLIGAGTQSNSTSTLTTRFLALPSTLRVYAVFLKQLAAKIRSVQLKSREKPQLDPDKYIGQLLQKFYRPRVLHFYDDVATLLTVVHHAAGLDETVQPGTLRKRYQRESAT